MHFCMQINGARCAVGRVDDEQTYRTWPNLPCQSRSSSFEQVNRNGARNAICPLLSVVTGGLPGHRQIISRIGARHRGVGRLPSFHETAPASTAALLRLQLR